MHTSAVPDKIWAQLSFCLLSCLQDCIWIPTTNPFLHLCSTFGKKQPRYKLGKCKFYTTGTSSSLNLHFDLKVNLGGRGGINFYLKSTHFLHIAGSNHALTCLLVLTPFKPSSCLSDSPVSVRGQQTPIGWIKSTTDSVAATVSTTLTCRLIL